MDSLPSDRGRSFDSFDPMASRYFGEDAVVESLRIARIRSNFSEINEKFKSGFSIMSTIKAMLEISKISSTLLPFGVENEEEGEDEGEENFQVKILTEDGLI